MDVGCRCGCLGVNLPFSSSPGDLVVQRTPTGPGLWPGLAAGWITKEKMTLRKTWNFNSGWDKSCCCGTIFFLWPVVILPGWQGSTHPAGAFLWHEVIGLLRRRRLLHLSPGLCPSACTCSTSDEGGRGFHTLWTFLFYFEVESSLLNGFSAGLHYMFLKGCRQPLKFQLNLWTLTFKLWIFRLQRCSLDWETFHFTCRFLDHLIFFTPIPNIFKICLIYFLNIFLKNEYAAFLRAILGLQKSWAKYPPSP